MMMMMMMISITEINKNNAESPKYLKMFMSLYFQ